MRGRGDPAAPRGVLDRFIQQAVMQVLQAAWDPTFSEASYGFRPARSAHQAIAKAQAYATEGYLWVVDIDLEKFFDRVNHDILMGMVAKRVSDRRLLRLLRGFLTAGVLVDGLVSPTDEGTPQGGPLSPLLSNLMLDSLDRELEARGHKHVRFADDCNIYARSRRAGERVMASVTKFLERRLKLRINGSKSAVDQIHRRKFLGFSFTTGRWGTKRRIARQSLDRLKKQVRELTRRTRGRSLAQVVEAQIVETARSYLGGWRAYFGFCETPPIRRCWAARTRPMDQAAPPGVGLVSVETRLEPLCRTRQTRGQAPTGGTDRLFVAWPLARRGQPSPQHRALQQDLRRTRSPVTRAESRLIQRTAVVRTRMPGGVGGGSRKASPYPDPKETRPGGRGGGAVMDQASLDGPAGLDGLVQGIEHESRGGRAADLPADDAPGEGIDDEGDVGEARRGRHIGEVRQPQFIGTVGRELPVDLVLGARRGLVGPRGPHSPAGLVGPRGPHSRAGLVGPRGPHSPAGFVGPRGPHSPAGDVADRRPLPLAPYNTL